MRSPLGMDMGTTQSTVERVIKDAKGLKPGENLHVGRVSHSDGYGSIGAEIVFALRAAGFTASGELEELIFRQGAGEFSVSTIPSIDTGLGGMSIVSVDVARREIGVLERVARIGGQLMLVLDRPICTRSERADHYPEEKVMLGFCEG